MGWYQGLIVLFFYIQLPSNISITHYIKQKSSRNRIWEEDEHHSWYNHTSSKCLYSSPLNWSWIHYGIGERSITLSHESRKPINLKVYSLDWCKTHQDLEHIKIEKQILPYVIAWDSDWKVEKTEIENLDRKISHYLVDNITCQKVSTAEESMH